ncbi:MAG: CRTAC1 family protein [Cyanobacteria bacterium P01_C01_bin.72]
MFQEVTNKSGIHYTGASFGTAWGDYNQDGWIDLWVSNHGSPATLYENQGDGTFVDVTLSAFGHAPRADFHGAAWADFDNDGDLDLVQLVGGDVGKSSLDDPEIANRFYVNEDGAFENQAIALGLGYIGSRSRNPLWFDFNDDGLLDLFQGAAKRSDGEVPATIFAQNRRGAFLDLSPTRDLDLDGSRFSLLTDLVGDSTPELITLIPKTGISVYNSNSLEDITDTVLDETYRGEDFIAEDFNGDLLPDLYITRRGLSRSAFNSPDSNTLNFNTITEANTQGVTWSTEGVVTIDLWTFGFAFEEIDPEDIFIGAAGLNPEDLGLPLGRANKTITELTLTLDPDDERVQGVAEFEPGKSSGLYIGYDPASTTWELQLSTPDKDLVAAIIRSPEEITATEAIGFNNELSPTDDLLLLNDGTELIDSTAGSGINSVRTAGVNTVAGDFDNDMDLDLYVVTANAAGNEPNVLYDNQGDGTFKAIADLGDGTGSNLGVGDTVSTVDYNNDGFLDLFVTNGSFPHLLNENAPYQLLENEGNDNHWLEIDLEGVVSNRDGIGAKVYVTAGGVTQLRQQTGGMHDQVQNSDLLHFGLADNTMVEDIRVEWSSGIVQHLEGINSNQILTIVEPDIIL